MKIDRTIIDDALLKYINMEEYKEQLQHLFTRKWDALKNKRDYSTRQKIYRYLLSKGYESNLITDLMHSIIGD
jgi:regulatory protein